MRQLRSKNRTESVWKELRVPLCCFLVITILVIRGISYFDNLNRMQNIDLTRQAVKRAALECYAIEGIYPSDETYLEENYSLMIDRDKYIVFYDIMASNIMPTIEVYEKR